MASTCQHLSGPHLCHNPLLPLHVFHVYRAQDLRDTWHVFVLYSDAKGLPVDQIDLEGLCDVILQKKVPFQSASSNDVISKYPNDVDLHPIRLKVKSYGEGFCDVILLEKRSLLVTLPHRLTPISTTSLIC